MGWYGWDKVERKELSAVIPGDNYDKPILFTGLESAPEFAPDTPLSTDCHNFKAKFAKHPLRAEKGRSERPMKGKVEVLANVQTLMNKILVGGFMCQS